MSGADGAGLAVAQVVHDHQKQVRGRKVVQLDFRQHVQHPRQQGGAIAGADTDGHAGHRLTRRGLRVG